MTNLPLLDEAVRRVGRIMGSPIRQYIVSSPTRVSLYGANWAFSDAAEYIRAEYHRLLTHPKQGMRE